MSTHSRCHVIPGGPAGFVPRVTAAVDANGTLVTTIACAGASVPVAAVTWSRGGQVISSGGRYRISADTTELSIVHPALNASYLGVYVCDAANPLGRQESSVRLLGTAEAPPLRSLFTSSSPSFFPRS